MSRVIPFKMDFTGSASIAAVAVVPEGDPLFFISLSLHIDSAPITAENITITLDAKAGSAYDAVFYTRDLIGVDDLLYLPDSPILLEAGDKIVISYPNTDGNTYGLQVTMKLKE